MKGINIDSMSIDELSTLEDEIRETPSKPGVGEANNPAGWLRSFVRESGLRNF